MKLKRLAYAACVGINYQTITTQNFEVHKMVLDISKPCLVYYHQTHEEISENVFRYFDNKYLFTEINGLIYYKLFWEDI